MFIYNNTNNSILKRLCHGFISFSFLLTSLTPAGISYAQITPVVNAPSMIAPSAGYTPALIKGLTIHPENPLKFDFIIDRGDMIFKNAAKKDEYQKMVKYFLAALTVPEEDLWVNLSPYEKDRIIPEGFGVTEMGRDLLAQDYILKQLTASLMYPERELGEQFWDKVYKKAQALYGNTDIPMDTFNKIWIVPERATVFERENTAFVADSYLRVMLEDDYLAMNHQSSAVGQQPLKTESQKLTTIMKELIVPEIEREVNQGEHFAKLRQIYNALILATWYKQALKTSLLGQVYVDQNKVTGVDIQDKNEKQKIYAQYLESFEKGIYNYIKEDYDPIKQEIIPRKYFSGGAGLQFDSNTFSKTTDFALLTRAEQANIGELIANDNAQLTDIDNVTVDLHEITPKGTYSPAADAAMFSKLDPGTFVLEMRDFVLRFIRQAYPGLFTGDGMSIDKAVPEGNQQNVDWVELEPDRSQFKLRIFVSANVTVGQLERTLIAKLSQIPGLMLNPGPRTLREPAPLTDQNLPAQNYMETMSEDAFIGHVSAIIRENENANIAIGDDIRRGLGFILSQSGQFIPAKGLSAIGLGNDGQLYYATAPHELVNPSGYPQEVQEKFFRVDSSGPQTDRPTFVATRINEGELPPEIQNKFGYTASNVLPLSDSINLQQTTQITTNLTSLLWQRIQSKNAELKHKGITLATNISTEEIMVEEKDRLHPISSVISRLLTMASTYTPNGETITVSLSHENNEAVFTLEIPYDENFNDKFAQEMTADGLHMILTITANDGSFNVEKGLNKETKLTVRLPISDAAMVATPVASREQALQVVDILNKFKLSNSPILKDLRIEKLSSKEIKVHLDTVEILRIPAPDQGLRLEREDGTLIAELPASPSAQKLPIVKFDKGYGLYLDGETAVILQTPNATYDIRQSTLINSDEKYPFRAKKIKPEEVTGLSSTKTESPVDSAMVATPIESIEQAEEVFKLFKALQKASPDIFPDLRIENLESGVYLGNIKLLSIPTQSSGDVPSVTPKRGYALYQDRENAIILQTPEDIFHIRQSSRAIDKNNAYAFRVKELKDNELRALVTNEMPSDVNLQTDTATRAEIRAAIREARLAYQKLNRENPNAVGSKKRRIKKALDEFKRRQQLLDKYDRQQRLRWKDREPVLKSELTTPPDAAMMATPVASIEDANQALEILRQAGPSTLPGLRIEEAEPYGEIKVYGDITVYFGQKEMLFIPAERQAVIAGQVVKLSPEQAPRFNPTEGYALYLHGENAVILQTPQAIYDISRTYNGVAINPFTKKEIDLEKLERLLSTEAESSVDKAMTSAATEYATRDDILRAIQWARDRQQEMSKLNPNATGATRDTIVALRDETRRVEKLLDEHAKGKTILKSRLIRAEFKEMQTENGQPMLWKTRQTLIDIPQFIRGKLKLDEEAAYEGETTSDILQRVRFALESNLGLSSVDIVNFPKHNGLDVSVVDLGKQVTGSFKPWIAYGLLKALSENESIDTIITTTTGNQGKGIKGVNRTLNVYYEPAGRRFDLKIYVPQNTPQAKLEGMDPIDELERQVTEIVGDPRKEGGAYFDNYDEAFKAGEAEAKRLGDRAYYVYHANEMAILSYTALGDTIVDQYVEQGLDLNTAAFIVPAGAGGIASGVAVAAKLRNPNVKIILVQSERTRHGYDSFVANELLPYFDPSNAKVFEDGIDTKSLEPLAFEILSELADGLVLVNSKKVSHKMGYYLENRVKAEGAAVLSHLAMEEISDQLKAQGVNHVVNIATGSNISNEDADLVNTSKTDAAMTSQYTGADVRSVQATLLQLHREAQFMFENHDPDLLAINVNTIADATGLEPEIIRQIFEFYFNYQKITERPDFYTAAKTDNPTLPAFVINPLVSTAEKTRAVQKIILDNTVTEIHSYLMAGLLGLEVNETQSILQSLNWNPVPGKESKGIYQNADADAAMVSEQQINDARNQKLDLDQLQTLHENLEKEIADLDKTVGDIYNRTNGLGTGANRFENQKREKEAWLAIVVTEIDRQLALPAEQSTDKAVLTNPSTPLILVVDDEAKERKLLEETLSAQGYNVITASDGDEAPQIVRDNPNIGAVLSDGFMARSTGFSMAKELFKIRPDLPVIIRTGELDSMRDPARRMSTSEVEETINRWKSDPDDNITDIIGKDTDSFLRSVKEHAPIEDKAMLTNVGGIDFSNPTTNLNLEIKRDGQGVPLPVHLQPIESMQIDGFLPVIINITPVNRLPMLSGLLPDDTERKAANDNEIPPSAYLYERKRAFVEN